MLKRKADGRWTIACDICGIEKGDYKYSCTAIDAKTVLGFRRLDGKDTCRTCRKGVEDGAEKPLA